MKKELLVRNYFFVLLLIIAHLLILNKLQFIAWPEMLSYPYLFNKGFLLYRDIINPYPPLIPVFLSRFYLFFGLNLGSLQLLSKILVIIIDLLLFVTVSKVFKYKQATLTLLVYIFLQPILEGNGLWFDLALVPFLIIIYYFCVYYLKADEKRKRVDIIALALLSSFIFLIKQNSLFIVLSVNIFLYLFTKKFRYLVIFIPLFFIPIIVVSFFIAIGGTFNDYLFWVYKYPFIHVQSEGLFLLPTIKQLAISLFLLIPSLIVLFAFRQDKRISVLGFIFIPCLLFIAPRFSYFHLQPILPFIALLVVYGLFQVRRKQRLILCSIFSILLLSVFIYFALKQINVQPRFYDKATIQTAKQLEIELKNESNVYFYNISSEFFVIADLLPTKPWVDTFSWYLEVDGLQKRIIDVMGGIPVNYIVKREFNNEGKDIPGSYRPKTLDQYINSNFTNFKSVTDSIQILVRKNIDKQL